jgi:hypothetical protein
MQVATHQGLPASFQPPILQPNCDSIRQTITKSWICVDTNGFTPVERMILH